MWITLFPLALAASVWFSAANLAVQLSKDQAAVNSTIESRRQMLEAPYRQLSSTEAEGGVQATLRFN